MPRAGPVGGAAVERHADQRDIDIGRRSTSGSRMKVEMPAKRGTLAASIGCGEGFERASLTARTPCGRRGRSGSTWSAISQPPFSAEGALRDGEHARGGPEILAAPGTCRRSGISPARRTAPSPCATRSGRSSSISEVSSRLGMLELGARESRPGRACRGSRGGRNPSIRAASAALAMPSRRSSRRPRSTPSTAARHSRNGR